MNRKTNRRLRWLAEGVAFGVLAALAVLVLRAAGIL